MIEFGGHCRSLYASRKKFCRKRRREGIGAMVEGEMSYQIKWISQNMLISEAEMIEIKELCYDVSRFVS